ncbi:TMEM165/GDT1 family protein [Halobium palmae]|uniref:TMEM165/GDT1 family protein n=1 Tax=Halobium palmae TaxID=1776492 RepID=A0ABD5S3P9_9EURY
MFHAPLVQLPLQSGLDSVVQRYSGHGPLLAAFLANLLATFGDKGQLVVVTLASRYDAKRVFAGAMAAFCAWSAVEVLLGRWITRTIPEGVMTLLTGGLFVLFGLWTLYSAYRHFSTDGELSPESVATGGGLGMGLTGRLLPDSLLARVGGYGGVLTSFVFIVFAEFGDKTQLLTINLAATFPDAPVAVFVGVVAALGLRTGVDAVIGEQAERWIPTKWIELGAAIVFVAFGLFVLKLIPSAGLLAVLGVLLLTGVAGLARTLLR